MFGRLVESEGEFDSGAPCANESQMSRTNMIDDRYFIDQDLRDGTIRHPPGRRFCGLAPSEVE